MCFCSFVHNILAITKILQINHNLSRFRRSFNFSRYLKFWQIFYAQSYYILLHNVKKSIFDVRALNYTEIITQ